MNYLKLEAGLKKQWTERSDYLNKTFQHNLEVTKEVEVVDCERCPCVNIDCEDGASCNLGEEIEWYNTKIIDSPCSWGDDYVCGSIHCPLLEVKTKTGTIGPPPFVKAYVAKRWFTEVEK